MDTNETHTHEGGAAKTLVCITPQSNGRRLIDRGAFLRDENGGSLHILYVQRGDDLFAGPDSARILQELFDYASGRRGIVHGLVGDDIVRAIAGFARKKGMTDVILGAPPKNAPAPTVPERLAAALPGVNVVVLERE